VLARFRNRILNVHPALLPAFGGQGMYGDRVHGAVLAAKARVSGATIHLVDEEYDHGPVVARLEVPVLPDDTIETLRARVQEAEQALFVRVLRDLAAEKIDLDAIGAG
jgi:phosphoribosylglycinamide formyltransferase-1